MARKKQSPRCARAKANVRRAVARFKKDYDKWPLYEVIFGEVDRRCLSFAEASKLARPVVTAKVFAMRRSDWLEGRR